MADLRAGEKTDELTRACLKVEGEVIAGIENWRKAHSIPFLAVERTETAQERTRLVVERIGEEAVRSALGW